MSIVVERPSRAKGTKAATEAARMMFLYGEGDGVRILDVQELAKRSGVHHMTIRARMPEWQNELEERLKATSKLASPKILSLPSETLEKHTSDTQRFRKQFEDLMNELESLPSIIDHLEKLVEHFSSDSEKLKDALVLLDKYFRLSMNRKSILKLAMDTKRFWDEKVGLDSLKNIQEAAGKAVAVASAKSGDEPKAEEGVVSVGGVFGKRS